MGKFLVIGHRGAAGYEPENTMSAFVKAIDMMVDAIEFDVRFSSDREVVVFHDPTLDRMTNGSGFVRNFVYHGELDRLNTGGGNTIPCLAKVLAVLGKGNLFRWKPCFNIELKEVGMIDEVLRLVRVYHLVDSVVVSAFDTNENEKGDTSQWVDLFVMKIREPDLRIALLVERAENFWRALEITATYGIKAYAVNPSKDIVTKEMVTAAHARGIKVFVWTVNEGHDIVRIKGMGADGAFSDYPDRIFVDGIQWV
ncbi:MAG: glycerophosphodiester phosphodiesterase family protein [Candidatus Liptonbacteria bacterium]|nr:glycerophosphodiester phosphodiesterase family protein [Candidatus Liptonbacteria bacterium]